MKWLRSGIILCLVLSAILAVPVPFAVDDTLRLPQTTFPISYDLEIQTSVHDGSRNFNGKVKILVEIRQTTKVVTLHNRGLSINSVVLKDSADQILTQTHREEIEKEFLHIESVNDLPLGEFSVEIIYTGLLNLDLGGFFRTSYRVGSELR